MSKSTDVIGAFAPSKSKTYEHTFSEETAPSGMLARGTYVAKTTLIDDDKTEHYVVEYKFDIGKDWKH